MELERRAGRTVRPLLAVAATGLVARAVARRGGLLRLGSLALHRLRRRPADGPPEESRLYADGRRRFEAHLARRDDGGRVVLALPVDGSARTAVYPVEEGRPWHDFERQAGLVGAAWGPCRSGSAGL